VIRRELRRRAAVEPVIGHLKAEHRMGCNHHAGRAGDAANALLAAIGYNFRRLIAWLAALLCLLRLAASNRPTPAANVAASLQIA
jgi:IS5 family transposase